MTFWADKRLEPKRQYRFLLSIGGDKIPAFIIKTSKKPSYTVTEKDHKFLNWQFWFPGRVEWDSIDITLVDPVDPDAATNVMRIINNAGYRLSQLSGPEPSADNIYTISKARAVTALGPTIYIQQLGPPVQNVLTTPDRVVEEWELRNPWIQKVDMGELSYDSEDFSEITLTIRYDFAILNNPSSGGQGIAIGGGAFGDAINQADSAGI